MSEWISVKNLPPDKTKPILIWHECLDFPITVYWKEEGTYGEPAFFENGDEYATKEETITHWQYPPEQPK
jgi:hypothetical protein